MEDVRHLWFGSQAERSSNGRDEILDLLVLKSPVCGGRHMPGENVWSSVYIIKGVAIQRKLSTKINRIADRSYSKRYILYGNEKNQINYFLIVPLLVVIHIASLTYFKQALD